MTIVHAIDLPARGRFEVRTIDLDHDLERIWTWWTADHVRGKWSMGVRLGPPSVGTNEHSIEDLRRYLTGLLQAHASSAGPTGTTLPVIGRLDGEDMCYIEVYDVGTSALASHPGLAPDDRGVHLIIGEPRFLGKGLIAVLGAPLLAWQFATHPKAQRVVVEPDAKNERALRAARGALEEAVEDQGNVALPHKVATLLSVERSAFAMFMAARSASRI